MSGDGAEEREGLEEGRRGGYQRAGQPSARRLSSPPPSLPPSLLPPAPSLPPSRPLASISAHLNLSCVGPSFSLLAAFLHRCSGSLLK